MTKTFTPDEINARLASTRHQKFRQRSQSQLEGINLRNADPEYNKKRNKAIENSQTQEWRANLTKSNRARSKRSEWLENTRKKNAKMYKDPTWQKNTAEGLEKRTKDPLWRKKNADKNTEILGQKCQVKEIGKSWKTFDSFGKAYEHYKWAALLGSKILWPEDGSTAVWQSRNKRTSKYVGWKFRRLL